MLIRKVDTFTTRAEMLTCRLQIWYVWQDLIHTACVDVSVDMFMCWCQCWHVYVLIDSAYAYVMILWSPSKKFKPDLSILWSNVVNFFAIFLVFFDVFAFFTLQTISCFFDFVFPFLSPLLINSVLLFCTSFERKQMMKLGWKKTSNHKVAVTNK
jgi:hypothetical protein